MKWALFCVLSCTIWCGVLSDYGWYTPVTKNNCDVKATGVIKILGIESATFEFRSHGNSYWMLIVDGEVQYLNRPDLNGFMDCSDGCTTGSQKANLLDFTYSSVESSSGCPAGTTSCKDYHSADGTYFYIADGSGHVWMIYEIGLFINPYEIVFKSYHDNYQWSPSDFKASSGTSGFTQAPSSSDFYGPCGQDPNPPPTPEPSPVPPTPGPSPTPHPPGSDSEGTGGVTGLVPLLSLVFLSVFIFAQN